MIAKSYKRWREKRIKEQEKTEAGVYLSPEELKRKYALLTVLKEIYSPGEYKVKVYEDGTVSASRLDGD